MAQITLDFEKGKELKTPSKTDGLYDLPALKIVSRSTVLNPELWYGISKFDIFIDYEDGTQERIDLSDEAKTITGYPRAQNSFSYNIPVIEKLRIKNGRNVVRYKVRSADYAYIPPESVDIFGYEGNNLTFTFIIYGVPNKLPLKPWTNKEVIERTLQIVEPLRKKQTPRFELEIPDGKDGVFNALAPEYTFTRLNLRECMQTVGGRIHAEPRVKTVDGKDKITFDFYGEQEYATIKNHKTNKTKRLSSYKYTTNKGVFDLEQTCTRLDSYMDNLVSRVDWERASIGQPYEGQKGGVTLRAVEYQRAEENDNFRFVTQYPIDRPIMLEAKTPSGVWVNITGYLYEQTVYSSNLSSFNDYAPSKAFAVYYTQGEKEIKGFFYKIPNATSGVGVNYSIVNIVKSVSGEKITDYKGMEFRLTYVPIYSTRVGHGKQYVNDYLPLPRTINYSQCANQVESRYFGQNIKSTAQRLGNIEKTYTFNVRNINNVPKAGQLWDENYYISTVSVEVGVDLLRVTVGLSKHFNRKSQYIGANSYRRVYEVSEVMVQERNTVYNDYLVVRDAQAQSNEFIAEMDNTLLSDVGFNYCTLGLFTDSYYTEEKKQGAEIAAVQFCTLTKNEDANALIVLPVISTAFGNGMEFTFECKDNYSAGERLETSPSDGNWVFGTGTPYGDYYGRGYYLKFTMLSKDQIDDTWSSVGVNVSTKTDFPLATGDYGYSRDNMVYASRMLYRKDSREKTKITYGVEFVADGDDFILGSGLTECNPLVSYVGRTPHLYVLPFRVNRFADRLTIADLSKEQAHDLGVIGGAGTTASKKFFRYDGVAYSGSGLSWCIAFPPETIIDGEVEDEDGNVGGFEREVGGEILIAKNVDISTVDRVGAFEIVLVHDLYEDYINKQ